MAEFHKGMRIRLSALGRERLCGPRSRRDVDALGTVAAEPMYSNTICVRWDGNKTSQHYHCDFIETVDPDLLQERTRAADDLRSALRAADGQIP